MIQHTALFVILIGIHDFPGHHGNGAYYFDEDICVFKNENIYPFISLSSIAFYCIIFGEVGRLSKSKIWELMHIQDDFMKLTNAKCVLLNDEEIKL